MSLVQGVPMLGRMMKQGLMTRVNKENREQGGIDGRIIRVIVKNDDYYPPKTRDNILEFIERGIDITLLAIGTPTLLSYLDLIKEGKLVALFPVTGAPILYTPEYDRVISFRASYDDEVRALINYIYSEIGDRIFAFLYQNDSYGQGPLESAHKILEKFGIKKWTDIAYTRGSTDMKEEAIKIKEAPYDAFGLFSTAQPTQALFRLMSVDTLVDKNLFAISPLAEESFRQFIKMHNIPIMFGAVVPNPQTSKLEIVEEYRKEMIKNGYRISAYALEGYLATTILIDVMKKINGPINQNSVTDMIKSIKNLDLQGLKLNYNPARSDLAQYVYLEIGENREWVRIEISSLY